jgi:hypothetical protein
MPCGAAALTAQVGAGGTMRQGGGGGAGGGGMSPARMIVKETMTKDRPDSKLTPSVLTAPSILESEVLEEEEDRMGKEEEGEGGEGGYGDAESRNEDEQQHQPTSTPQQSTS